MVSGFDPYKVGAQIITVKYGDFTDEFIVHVKERPQDSGNNNNNNNSNDNNNNDNNNNGGNNTGSTIKPSGNNNKPTTGTTTQSSTSNSSAMMQENTENNAKEVVESTIDTEAVGATQDTEEIEENKTTTKKDTEKPVIQHTNPDDEIQAYEDARNRNLERIAIVILATASAILTILLAFRKDVKIYVEENGEFVLGGWDKLTKKRRDLDVNKHLDGDTYSHRVKVLLNDAISKKLDGKEIKIKFRNEIVNIKVKYENRPFQFILE